MGTEACQVGSNEIDCSTTDEGVIGGRDHMSTLVP